MRITYFGHSCFFVETSRARCAEHDGVYRGDGTECAKNSCDRRACPCDWNHDGVLDRADLDAFLADFMDRDADFNRDGETTVEDLHAFLECFAHRCG